MPLWRTSTLASDTPLNPRNHCEASVDRTPWPSLQESIDSDVLVMGGGFAGPSAAIERARRGMPVVLPEAERICSGASGRNGGQAIVGDASGQLAFEDQLGPAGAQCAWSMSPEMLDLIDSRIAAFGIDCDRKRGYSQVADASRKARAAHRARLRACLRLRSRGCRAWPYRQRVPGPALGKWYRRQLRDLGEWCCR